VWWPRPQKSLAPSVPIVVTTMELVWMVRKHIVIYILLIYYGNDSFERRQKCGGSVMFLKYIDL
jgi:hypothetical protein